MALDYCGLLFHVMPKERESGVGTADRPRKILILVIFSLQKHVPGSSSRSLISGG